MDSDFLFFLLLMILVNVVRTTALTATCLVWRWRFRRVFWDWMGFQREFNAREHIKIWMAIGAISSFNKRKSLGVLCPDVKKFCFALLCVCGGGRSCLHKEDFGCILASYAFLLIFLPFPLPLPLVKRLLLSEKYLGKKFSVQTGIAQMPTQMPKKVKMQYKEEMDTRNTE